MKSSDTTNTSALPKTLWGFYAQYAIRPFKILSMVYLLGLGAAWIIMEIFRPLFERYFYGLFDNGLLGDNLTWAVIIAIGALRQSAEAQFDYLWSIYHI